MKNFAQFLILLGFILTSTVSNGLTFKKGEVLGSDGKVYEGASLTQLDRLISKAKKSGDSAGVTGQSVFIVVEDGVVFVPISDIAGKTKETIKVQITASVVARVVEDSTQIKLRVDDLAAEIRLTDGNVESAVSALIEKVSNDIDVSLPVVSTDLLTSAQDQQLSNEEAIAKLMDEDLSIETAVSSWATMSNADKQNLVDQANSAGILGCSDCSILDAEEFVKEVAKTNGIEIDAALSNASVATSKTPNSVGFRLKDETVAAASASATNSTFGFRQKTINEQQSTIQEQAELASRQQQALSEKVKASMQVQQGAAISSARAQRSINETQQAIERLSEAETKAALEKAYKDAAKQTEQLLASGSLQQRIDAVIGAAIEAVDRAGDDIDQAISAWDSMSDTQKQALVDKVNREGLLGCTNCSVQDAEAYANSKR